MKIDTPTLRWTSSVLKLMFHMAWDLWQDRNNIKHHTATAAKMREMAHLDQEIEEHRMTDMTGISHADKKHLTLSVERQQNMTVEQKCQWLHMAEAIRVAYANRDDATNLPPGHRPLTDWFQTIPP